MALQDLTPQLRTRLNRTEKAAGWFVLLAIFLLLFGFSYYLYNIAKNKGWFITKIHYETGVNNAEGLKVGDPVQLMGNNVGEITEIKDNDPNAYYGMTVYFSIKAPHYGYIWGDSMVEVQASFLGSRYLEVTKGKLGMPTVLETTNHEITGILIHKRMKERQKELTAEGKGLDEIWTTLKAEAAVETNGYYEEPSDEAVCWLVPAEAPSLNDRADKLVSQVEAALPNILALTNDLKRVLANSGNLTSNLDAVAENLRPAASNLAYITAELRGQGAFGNWALGSTNMSRVGTTLDSANLAISHTDTNLVALFDYMDGAISNLANITGNLNRQVQANTNILSNISKSIVDADDFVQGLKHHWLFRSAFRKKATNSPAH